MKFYINSDDDPKSPEFQKQWEKLRKRLDQLGYMRLAVYYEDGRLLYQSPEETETVSDQIKRGVIPRRPDGSPCAS